MERHFFKIKSLFTLFLSLALFFAFCMPINVCASEYSDTNSEIDALIENIDEEKLLQDAANDIIDEQVPLELNQSMIADVDFISSSDLDDTTFDIHKTVQKVDDITYGNGETATLYVSAAVATETTLDKGFTEENGIVAHIFVYWIDNLGTNNELYSIQVWWDLNDKEAKNRSVQYGTMNLLGTSFTDSETVSINVNDYTKDVNGKYYGFVVGCASSIEVTNLGTVKLTVHSTFTS